jgi:hypothetical protein
VRKQLLPALTMGWLVLAGADGRAVYAQGLPSGPLELADGRVTVGGDVSATFSCAATPDPADGRCGDDTGFFNYSDYEHSTLRMIRIGVSAAVRANEHLSLLTEVRTENGEPPQAYALYVRLRPSTSLPLDIQAGRIPPTFGAFARRAYSSDNPLIGYPLGYQYLTSIRPDAVPATADELIRMRGRGWLSSFSLGNPVAERGLPLATVFQWDTGVQVHASLGLVDLTGSVTSGSLAHPLFGDDNDGKQFAGRIAARPFAGLVAGVSATRGAFLTRDAATSAGSFRSRDFPQTALGADLEYSRDYYLIRFEGIFSRWQLPTIAVPLEASAISIEGRYKFRPGWHVAARFDHLGFSQITASTTTTWDAPVTRVELGGGYLIRRNIQVKASWQHNGRDAGRVHHLNLASVQTSVWF